MPEPAAEPVPNVPMWVRLRVCECGRVGEWGTTRCGRDGRTNMSTACPTVAVPYIPMYERWGP